MRKCALDKMHKSQAYAYALFVENYHLTKWVKHDRI